jgi:spore maturation protein CgeB
MHIVMFYHSLISDWNHGNAHFLRGVVTELINQGHKVRVYEPRKSWSLENLLARHGNGPVERFKKIYPGLESSFYEGEALDLDRELDGADLVIVHEWNDPKLVRKIGEHRVRAGGPYRLLFHDTHHRSVTEPDSLASFDLGNFDGVLAYGNVIRDIYLEKGWTEKVWTWHEAADTRIFYPLYGPCKTGDLVWIGNWGDDERSAELREFLIEPVKDLAIRAQAYGVRYPHQGLSALADAGIKYAGWLPNYAVPHVFSKFRLTVHIPRRPYSMNLPGIPTIRVFESLACGIPLICSYWDDAEGLFTPGEDFLLARDGKEMKEHIQAVLHDPELVRKLRNHGRRTILARHTCEHRVKELIAICRGLGISQAGSTTTIRESHFV